MATLGQELTITVQPERSDLVRRTTIMLRAEDQENLKAIASQSGTTDTEAIRRALRLMRELLNWEREEGGTIVLEKGRRRERIRFL